MTSQTQSFWLCFEKHNGCPLFWLFVVHFQPKLLTQLGPAWSENAQALGSPENAQVMLGDRDVQHRLPHLLLQHTRSAGIDMWGRPIVQKPALDFRMAFPGIGGRPSTIGGPFCWVRPHQNTRYTGKTLVTKLGLVGGHFLERQKKLHQLRPFGRHSSKNVRGSLMFSLYYRKPWGRNYSRKWTQLCDSRWSTWHCKHIERYWTAGISFKVTSFAAATYQQINSPIF